MATAKNEDDPSDTRSECQDNTQEMQLDDTFCNMKKFSELLSSLFNEDNLSSILDSTVLENNAKKFKEKLEDARKETVVYVELTLPFVKRFFETFRFCLEIYKALEFEDWKECFPSMFQDLKNSEQLLKKIIESYERMLVCMKECEQEGKMLITELTVLENAYSEKARSFEESATFMDKIRNFCFSKKASIEKEKAEKEKTEKEKEIASRIETNLVQVMTNIIDGFEKIAGFFECLESDIYVCKRVSKIECKPQEQSKKQLENLLKVRYKMMKGKCDDILCQMENFIKCLPVVRTSMKAIFKKETDNNYLKECKEKYMAELEEQETTNEKTEMNKVVEIVVNIKI